MESDAEMFSVVPCALEKKPAMRFEAPALIKIHLIRMDSQLLDPYIRIFCRRQHLSFIAPALAGANSRRKCLQLCARAKRLMRVVAASRLAEDANCPNLDGFL